MSVSLDHPLVADYLRRLDVAAARLPAGRRGELIEEIRGHVGDALAAIGDDESAVRGVLDRLGSPEDIVAAEDGAGEHGAAGNLTAPTAADDRAAGLPGAAPPAYSPNDFQSRAPAQWSGSARSSWGPVEVIAVVGLTIGTFVLPGVGPLIGLICAVVSHRWTTREKVVATALAAVPIVIVAAAGMLLFAVRSGGTQSVSVSGDPVVTGTSSAAVSPLPATAVSP